jgi:hypothetical protein
MASRQGRRSSPQNSVAPQQHVNELLRERRLGGSGHWAPGEVPRPNV